jgi:NitT/TauT family transport system permease protein
MTGKKKRFRWPLQLFTTPGLLLLFLLGWHFYVKQSHISAFILPSPLQVANGVVQLLQDSSTWLHIWVTIEQTIFGFVLACVFGVSLGVVVGKTPWLEQTLNPFIIASQVVPKVALVPLFIVWFGFGGTSKIIIAAVLAFFPVFTNTVLGVKSIDIGHRDVMTSLNASAWARFVRLELPSASPYILTGMEVGIVLAVIGCVVAQFLGGNDGLGYLLVAKMNAYQTDLLFAVIILLTAIGFVFYLLIGALRRLVIPWHDSVSGQ